MSASAARICLVSTLTLIVVSALVALARRTGTGSLSFRFSRHGFPSLSFSVLAALARGTGAGPRSVPSLHFPSLFLLAAGILKVDPDPDPRNTAFHGRVHRVHHPPRKCDNHREYVLRGRLFK
ncbi:hypothetical protein B0H11DRAFT_1961564 [Mycena galericulata]|nr:hypothetical protein B0H11DRAFT_1961564 [Mycena galericulata]